MNVSLRVQLEHTEMLSSLSANDLYSFVCNVVVLCAFYDLVGFICEWSSQPCVEGSAGLSQRPSCV